ncbi:MAG: hypothetical protein QW734_03825 [Candidatus Bathyarchaeia archaeon]
MMFKGKIIARQGNMFRVIWNNGEDIVYIVDKNNIYAYVKKIKFNKNEKAKTH